MPDLAREQGSPIGAYVHVPFCRRKCAYCGFYSVAVEPGRSAPFLDALERDLFRRASPGVQTLYVGGGTPTVLPEEHLERLLGMLRKAFPSVEEFTVEANPGTVTGRKAFLLKDAGVTRVSLGVQTTSVRLLAALGRAGAGSGWERAVDLLLRAGFVPSDLSADLIYGVSGQTAGDVERDVEAVSSVGFGHVSLYALSLEPGSRLGRLRRPVTAPDEDCGVMYRRAEKALRSAGFARYEVSNFARGGRLCRHNLNYWTGGEWQAFGPSAVGQENGRRYSIRPDWRIYAAEAPDAPVDFEDLSPARKTRERIMLGLRLDAGLDVGSLEEDVRRVVMQAAAPLVDSGFLSVAGTRLRVPVRHAMVLDEITAEILAAI